MKHNRNRVQAQIRLRKPAYRAFAAGNLRDEVSEQVIPAMSRSAAERGRRLFGDVILSDVEELSDVVALTFVSDTEPA